VIGGPRRADRDRPGTWLRGETEPTRHRRVRGRAELSARPDSFLNGAHLSAKRSVRLGRRAWVGLGSRVFDSDQHDYDAEHPEAIAAGRDRRLHRGWPPT
jgi:hypothetical protein